MNLQLAVKDCSGLPTEAQFDKWIMKTLEKIGKKPKEVTIRIVDADEMIDLNFRYRGKRSVTNVLSFPFEKVRGVDYEFFGDIVICAPKVKQEARSQRKSIIAHCAHLVIHGTLHFFLLTTKLIRMPP